MLCSGRLHNNPDVGLMMDWCLQYYLHSVVIVSVFKKGKNSNIVSLIFKRSQVSTIRHIAVHFIIHGICYRIRCCFCKFRNDPSVILAGLKQHTLSLVPLASKFRQVRYPLLRDVARGRPLLPANQIPHHL